MKQESERPRYTGSPGRRDFDPVGLATLVGVVALLMITYSNMRDVDRLDIGLGQRLGRLEDKIAQIQRAPTTAAAPAQGLDPDRIYTVKTGDAPSRGSASAAVTIAEFS